MGIAGKILNASIPVLLSLYLEKYRQEDFQKTFVDDPPNLNLPVKETYDFIIVGGGGAGCVVARRLSDAQFNVLLLEAGGNPDPLSYAPLLFYLGNQPVGDYLIHYETAPQKHVVANVSTCAGRVLGGGTTLSGLVYERGHPRDYEKWAEITGDSSWLYKNVLKYFLKHEDYMGKFPLDGQHSQGGPMGVEQPGYHPVQEEFLQAGIQLGFEVNDPNGPNKIGFSPGNIYTRNGRRQSTYLAYVKPVEKSQEYLTIYRYSAVSRVQKLNFMQTADFKSEQKVLFEGQRAVGVEYKRHGVPRVAFASKEVILSAGPHTTPIILIKSGIGPEDQLRAATAQPLSIRPVGQNFINHLHTPVQIKVERSKSWYLQRDLTFTDVDLFLKQGKGPLANSDQVAFAYLTSSRAKKDGEHNWPDLHLAYRFADTFLSPKAYGNCLVSVARPRSRGRITYNSSATDILDPYSATVDPEYFSDQSDFQVALEGVEYCKRIIETKAFQGIGAEMFPGKKPKACRQFNKQSRDYWACFIRHRSRSYQNVGGTARMGRIDDDGAVVGPRLKVIGVEGLRVVDSSVIPVLTNGQTTAPTVMIAEKASAEIIQEYSDSNPNLRSRSSSTLRSKRDKGHCNKKNEPNVQCTS